MRLSDATAAAKFTVRCDRCDWHTTRAATEFTVGRKMCEHERSHLAAIRAAATTGGESHE